MNSTNDDPTESADQEWTAEAIQMMLALTRHTVHDRDAVYDACEWHHVATDYEIDVLGYEVTAGGPWRWSAEFVAGTRYPTDRGLRWHTNGHGILSVESKHFEDITAAIVQWFAYLDQVRPELPYPKPLRSQERMHTG